MSDRNQANQSVDTLTRLCFAGLFVWWSAAFVATHLPLPQDATGQSIPHLDKAVHFVIYTGLAFLSLSGIARLRTASAGVVLALAGVLALYGFVDEISQIPVGRHADPLDWLADLSGIGAGLPLAHLVSMAIPGRKPLTVAAD